MHLSKELVDFVDSELVIKALDDGFSLVGVEFQNANTGVDHKFGVVPFEERRGVHESVDLVQIVVVVELVIEV